MFFVRKNLPEKNKLCLLASQFTMRPNFVDAVLLTDYSHKY